MKKLTVLVCGSRDWSKRGPIEAFLAGLSASHDLTVVEGDARGADRIAGRWAAQASVRHAQFPAAWKEHADGWCPGDWCRRRSFCVAAGPRRNQEMLDWMLVHGGDNLLVLAFKERFDFSLSSGGTEDMVKRALDANVSTYVVEVPTLP